MSYKWSDLHVCDKVTQMNTDLLQTWQIQVSLEEMATRVTFTNHPPHHFMTLSLFHMSSRRLLSYMWIKHLPFLAKDPSGAELNVACAQISALRLHINAGHRHVFVQASSANCKELMSAHLPKPSGCICSVAFWKSPFLPASCLEAYSTESLIKKI